jgi:hypothetical protein
MGFKVHLDLYGLGESEDTPAKWAAISSIVTTVMNHSALLAYYM